MDMDGANVKYLGGGEELVVTPRFSPSAQQVAYMSFGAGDPKVTLLNLETGQREAVGNFPGMTFAPRFSPDGQDIVMSLSDGASTNLYTMDLRSRATTRLTEDSAIDTSPTYSPDGSQIAFESDRGGTQQIYVMSATGGPAKRISFGDGRYSTPVWSPRGDLIAFTRIKGGSFGIGVMKPDGSGERILVEGFHNEGPTFAPNGLYVMFFRDASGSGGPKIYMTDIFGHGEFLVPTPNYASDPSWGPLLELSPSRSAAGPLLRAGLPLPAHRLQAIEEYPQRSQDRQLDKGLASRKLNRNLVRGIALDRLSIEPPGRVPEHRHDDGKPGEKRQRAQSERRRNDQSPKRDGLRIGAGHAQRSLKRGDKANVAVEHQREGNHADAKRERGEAEADHPADDDEQPAALGGQHIGEEGQRRGRRIGSVKPSINKLGGEDPRGEDHEQKQAECQDRR